MTYYTGNGAASLYVRSLWIRCADRSTCNVAVKLNKYRPTRLIYGRVIVSRGTVPKMSGVSSPTPPRVWLPSVHVSDATAAGVDERWCPVRCEEEGAKVQKIPGFPAYVVHVEAEEKSTTSSTMDTVPREANHLENAVQSEDQQPLACPNATNVHGNTPKRRKYLSVQDLVLPFFVLQLLRSVVFDNCE